MSSPAVIQDLEKMILTVRGQKEILDSDLATLYGVPTKIFNQAIKLRQEFATTHSPLKEVFKVIGPLLTPPPEPVRKKIGFHP